MKHLTSGSDKIPSELITIQKGLTDRRFFVLKKNADHKVLGAILMKQIESLQNFLNVKTKLSPDQLGETASLILDEYDDLSYTAIMDCFNRIKMAKPPFNDKLYESIDGRKIFEFLERYRMFQIEYLENKHQDQKQHSEFNITPKNEQFNKVITSLSEQLKIDAVNRKIKQEQKENETKKRTKTDQQLLIESWMNEFHKMHPEIQPPGAMDEYLNKRLEEHLKQQQNGQ